MAGLNTYKVTFDNNTYTEINTPLDLTNDFVKSELEKVSSVEVVKVQKLTDTDFYNPNIKTTDLYFSVDFDYMGVPRFFNRILVPSIKLEYIPWESDDILNAKMETLTKNLFGVNAKLKSCRRS